jgi:hypothetical protein
MIVVTLSSLLLALGIVGCETGTSTDVIVSDVESGPSWAKDDVSYEAVRVKIMPLTKFVSDGEGGVTGIEVYVSLLDSFNSQIKGPGVFRFELYEKVIRNPEPKGKRINIWPDIDLRDAVENNKYWQDYLRGYKFKLDYEGRDGQYVLQVTFLSVGGKRLVNEFNVQGRGGRQ